MKTETKDIEMLARINVQYPRLAGWLQDRLAATDESARKSKDDVDVRWAQGRAQELVELISWLESAADILRKADERASKRKSA